jgi:cyclic-di-AMP phosphodiesterase PgpH
MKKLIKLTKGNLKILFIGSLFLGATIIISYFFPREGRFRFEYQKNHPWMHDDLQAPFNFPIHKTSARLALERDSVLKQFVPYFSYDGSMVSQQVNKFKQAFDTNWINYTLREFNIGSKSKYLQNKRYSHLRELQDNYREYMASLLEKVYLSGIIDFNDYIEQSGKVPSSIVLVKGNIAEEKDTSEIFTSKSAYDYVLSNFNKFVRSQKDPYAKRYGDFFREFDINNFIEVNVYYDEATSNKVKKSMLDGISLTEGMIQEGQRIVSKGDLITPEKFQILESLRKEYEEKLGTVTNYLVKLGKFVIVFFSMLVIFLFLWNFRREVLDDTLKTSFILLMIVLFIVIASFTYQFNKISFYIIPFTILPIVIRTFYDARLALFIHIVTMLMVSFFVPSSFEFVFLNILAGIIAIFSLTNLYRRSKLVVSAAMVVGTYAFVYFGISIFQEGNLSQVEWQNFGWFGINGLLMLVSYPLIYIFEKSFGFLSDATLMELSDTNQPLLRKLAETAPGTFQHSLQVANLAEDAIFKIGGNPLIIRTGALYHDIGKMVDPIYFIENQSGDVSPHDNLTFEESANKIISHVTEGVDMAKKYLLPEPLIDFIRTHHGTSTVQYFYKSYIKTYPEEEVDIRKFSYPGPIPFSKEMAVLMMADSVEAASRSLKTINDKTLDKLVDGIIDYQQSEGQFNNANITFKDITDIKEVFKKRLHNIYHARISYPK